jgi:hypothetical protein
MNHEIDSKIVSKVNDLVALVNSLQASPDEGNSGSNANPTTNRQVNATDRQVNTPSAAVREPDDHKAYFTKVIDKPETSLPQSDVRRMMSSSHGLPPSPLKGSTKYVCNMTTVSYHKHGHIISDKEDWYETISGKEVDPRSTVFDSEFRIGTPVHVWILCIMVLSFLLHDVLSSQLNWNGMLSIGTVLDGEPSPLNDGDRFVAKHDLCPWNGTMNDELIKSMGSDIFAKGYCLGPLDLECGSFDNMGSDKINKVSSPIFGSLEWIFPRTEVRE